MPVLKNVLSSVSNGLSRFDWDVFLPVKDEQELESLSGDDRKQIDSGISYIIAGVVFDHLELNSSFHNSKTAKIRIRTNNSAVLGTASFKAP